MECFYCEDIVVTSIICCFWRASETIFSNLTVVALSIQSEPQSAHTVAVTSLTTTTPKPNSAVNVVFPFFFVPPQLQ